jgi:hypothetical protein
MDLEFGTHVREHFYSIGRLAGIEADGLTHAVRNIVVRAEAALEVDAVRRPFGAVLTDHFDGDIELRGFPDDDLRRSTPTVTLSASTRLVRDGSDLGHLVGVEINPDTAEIVSVVGRHHWWTPRLHLSAATLDFSKPGEIRVA